MVSNIMLGIEMENRVTSDFDVVVKSIEEKSSPLKCGNKYLKVRKKGIIDDREYKAFITKSWQATPNTRHNICFNIVLQTPTQDYSICTIYHLAMILLTLPKTKKNILLELRW